MICTVQYNIVGRIKYEDGSEGGINKHIVIRLDMKSCDDAYDAGLPQAKAQAEQVLLDESWRQYPDRGNRSVVLRTIRIGR